MSRRLVDYLTKNNIISPSQYSFRSGRSTSDAVHDLSNSIKTNLDRGQKVIGIFLDLAKAFDTVSVPILIEKIKRLGIRGTPLRLFEDYLSERTQCVRVDEFISEERIVTYGVAQGSVIGPTLFLIYINDLGLLTLPNGKVITFADDTALLFNADTWSDAYKHAQSGFNVVSDWLRNNILTLNATKTQYVTFSITHKTAPNLPMPHSIIAHSCPSPHNVTCSCVHLQKADAVKYLGVIMDSRLRFHEHISYIYPQWQDAQTNLRLQEPKASG
ncbi:unnamed protein product [Arctia plantaginis]|uniref:Reverse transcriptase domain-containing protein n=1 Tax=Arctia plantaginis TaxID=874455 RepID=A0A8S1BR40_ARCPL|nr:unnamed protein product [Arctia plantaginis]